MLQRYHKFTVISSFHHAAQCPQEKQYHKIYQHQKECHIAVQRKSIWISAAVANQIRQYKGHLQTNLIQQYKIKVLYPSD